MKLYRRCILALMLLHAMVVLPSGAATYIDVIFAIDESDSVDAPEFLAQQNYVSQIVAGLSFGPSAVKGGLVGWAGTSRVVQALTLTKITLLNAVSTMTRTGGFTLLAPCLAVAEGEIEGVGGRAGAERVVVFIDEGSWFDSAGVVEAKADDLAAQGYHLFPIGQGSVYDSRLSSLARNDGRFFAMTNSSASVVAAAILAVRVPPVNGALTIPAGGLAGLTVTNQTIGRTNALTAALDLQGPWNTIQLWNVTGSMTNVNVAFTNQFEFFRVEVLP